MPNNNSRITTGAVILTIIVVAFGAGFWSGKSEDLSSSIPAGISNATSGAPTDVDFSSFWKAWNILNDNFVSATTTASSTQAKVYGAITGMTASLGDPYTVFFPPKENKNFNEQISGSFSGVGMEMGVQNGLIVVIAPLKGTPADAAGVKAGDVLTKVGDTDVSTLSLDDVISMIRGPLGTDVSITVNRKGSAAPLTFTMTRANIDVPTIETNNVQSSISALSTTTLATLNNDHIFLITLYTFTADAANLFRGALKQFAQSGDRKLIIDLRGNPGGYLDAAVDMASWFLPSSDVVVREKYSDGHEDVFQSKGYDVFDPIDLVILVNGGSASASEIFAGALREYDKATLVGVKTFGKGSVQELFPITGDTSIKVTIAKWLTPHGISISEKGIAPDYVVPVTDADTKAGIDAQMNKAISVLEAKN